MIGIFRQFSYQVKGCNRNLKLWVAGSWHWSLGRTRICCYIMIDNFHTWTWSATLDLNSGIIAIAQPLSCLPSMYRHGRNGQHAPGSPFWEMEGPLKELNLLQLLEPCTTPTRFSWTRGKRTFMGQVSAPLLHNQVSLAACHVDLRGPHSVNGWNDSVRLRPTSVSYIRSRSPPS